MSRSVDGFVSLTNLQKSASWGSTFQSCTALLVNFSLVFNLTPHIHKLWLFPLIIADSFHLKTCLSRAYILSFQIRKSWETLSKALLISWQTISPHPHRQTLLVEGCTVDQEWPIFLVNLSWLFRTSPSRFYLCITHEKKGIVQGKRKNKNLRQSCLPKIWIPRNYSIDKATVLWRAIHRSKWASAWKARQKEKLLATRLQNTLDYFKTAFMP